MATSQFTIYSSADAGAPPLITGAASTLITVLDACLVNGYGSKPAAGWTKPLPNSASIYACYKQPSGSQFTLFINDSNAFGSINEKTAGATGWTTMTSLASGSSIQNVGVGTGQFPTPVQLLTYGRVAIRKSAANDTTTQRTWIVAADAYTMYLWIYIAADSGYNHFAFGDFYSLYGTSDVGRCIINGRPAENSNAAAGNDMLDAISIGWYSTTNYLSQGFYGFYIAKTASGTGQSIIHTRKGDASLSTGVTTTYNGATTIYGCPMGGMVSSPNPTDNNWYLSPLWVVEPSGTGASLRGKYRGLYQICHPTANFADGQLIQGSGTYAGKTFVVIKPGFNGGMWCLETSNTVLTN